MSNINSNEKKYIYGSHNIELTYNDSKKYNDYKIDDAINIILPLKTSTYNSIKTTLSFLPNNEDTQTINENKNNNELFVKNLEKNPRDDIFLDEIDKNKIHFKYNNEVEKIIDYKKYKGDLDFEKFALIDSLEKSIAQKKQIINQDKIGTETPARKIFNNKDDNGKELGKENLFKKKFILEENIIGNTDNIYFNKEEQALTGITWPIAKISNNGNEITVIDRDGNDISNITLDYYGLEDNDKKQYIDLFVQTLNYRVKNYYKENYKNNENNIIKGNDSFSEILDSLKRNNYKNIEKIDKDTDLNTVQFKNNTIFVQDNTIYLYRDNQSNPIIKCDDNEFKIFHSKYENEKFNIQNMTLDRLDNIISEHLTERQESYTNNISDLRQKKLSESYLAPIPYINFDKQPEYEKKIQTIDDINEAIFDKNNKEIKNLIGDISYTLSNELVENEANEVEFAKNKLKELMKCAIVNPTNKDLSTNIENINKYKEEEYSNDIELDKTNANLTYKGYKYDTDKYKICVNLNKYDINKIIDIFEKDKKDILYKKIEKYKSSKEMNCRKNLDNFIEQYNNNIKDIEENKSTIFIEAYNKYRANNNLRQLTAREEEKIKGCKNYEEMKNVIEKAASATTQEIRDIVKKFSLDNIKEHEEKYNKEHKEKMKIVMEKNDDILSPDYLYQNGKKIAEVSKKNDAQTIITFLNSKNEHIASIQSNNDDNALKEGEFFFKDVILSNKDLYNRKQISNTNNIEEIKNVIENNFNLKEESSLELDGNVLTFKGMYGTRMPINLNKANENISSISDKINKIEANNINNLILQNYKKTNAYALNYVTKYLPQEKNGQKNEKKYEYYEEIASYLDNLNNLKARDILETKYFKDNPEAVTNFYNKYHDHILVKPDEKFYNENKEIIDDLNKNMFIFKKNSTLYKDEIYLNNKIVARVESSFQLPERKGFTKIEFFDKVGNTTKKLDLSYEKPKELNEKDVEEKFKQSFVDLYGKMDFDKSATKKRKKENLNKVSNLLNFLNDSKTKEPLKNILNNGVEISKKGLFSKGGTISLKANGKRFGMFNPTNDSYILYTPCGTEEIPLPLDIDKQKYILDTLNKSIERSIEIDFEKNFNNFLKKNNIEYKNDDNDLLIDNKGNVFLSKADMKEIYIDTIHKSNNKFFYDHSPEKVFNPVIKKNKTSYEVKNKNGDTVCKIDCKNGNIDNSNFLKNAMNSIKHNAKNIFNSIEKQTPNKQNNQIKFVGMNISKGKINYNGSNIGKIGVGFLSFFNLNKDVYIKANADDGITLTEYCPTNLFKKVLDEKISDTKNNNNIENTVDFTRSKSKENENIKTEELNNVQDAVSVNSVNSTVNLNDVNIKESNNIIVENDTNQINNNVDNNSINTNTNNNSKSDSFQPSQQVNLSFNLGENKDRKYNNIISEDKGNIDRRTIQTIKSLTIIEKGTTTVIPERTKTIVTKNNSKSSSIKNI